MTTGIVRTVVLPAAQALLVAAAAWGLSATASSDGRRATVLLPLAWWLLPLFAAAALMGRRRLWLVPAAVVLLPLSGLLAGAPAVMGWHGAPALTVTVLTAILAVDWRIPRVCRDGPVAGLCVVALTASWAATLAVMAARAAPTGDEPHYLMLSTSLVDDFDLAPDNNYLDRQYLAFYPGELGEYGNLNSWHLMPRPTGRVVSIHSPGVAVLVAPGFAAAGVPGARAMMVLISALAAFVFWRTARMLSGSAEAAWAAWLTLVVSEPFAILASRVYPDGPAVVGTIAAFWLLVRLWRGDPPSAAGIAVIGGILGALPWFQVRLALIDLVFGAAIVVVLARSLRRVDLALVFAAVLACSGLGLVMWTWYTAGTLNPAFVYSGGLHPEWFVGGVIGLLVDQESGLLVYAPVYAGTAVMLPGLWRASRLVASVTVLQLLGVLLGSATYIWWGGSSPPARLMASVLPGLALATAVWWPASTALGRSLWKVAVGFGGVVSVAITAADRGLHLSANGDGPSNLLTFFSRSVDLASALPSFLPAGSFRSDDVAIAGSWALLGLVAYFALRWILNRRAWSRDGALTVMMLVLVATMSLGAALSWKIRGASGWRPRDAAQSSGGVPRPVIEYVSPPPSFRWVAD